MNSKLGLFSLDPNVVIKIKFKETEPPHNEVKGSRELVNCDVITKITKQSSLEFTIDMC